MSLWDGDMQEGGPSQFTGTEDSVLETLLGPILYTSSSGCSS